MKKILIGGLLLFSGQALATDYECSGTAWVGGTYTLPHKDRMITPPNTGNLSTGNECTTTNCTILFSAINSTPRGSGGGMTETCTPKGSFKIGWIVDSTQSGIIYKHTSGYIIYPTSVKGIGVSVNAGQTLHSSRPALLHWPDAQWLRSFTSATQVDTYVDIRVWKTPEFTPAGDLNFTGPTVLQVVSTDSSSDRITSCPSGRLDDRTCIWFSKVIVGSTNFKSGTCEIINTNRIVRLGSYMSGTNKSPWVDSSFKLQCPAAYGYGSSLSNSSNESNVNDKTGSTNTRNKPVKIQIVPYSDIINSAQGIFALTPGGAEGYGIQLAWGAPGEQTDADNPVNPVAFGFNNRVLASSKNSNFSNGSGGYIPLNGRALAVGADGTIKMSARYIRNSDPVKAGPANGRVEIIAAYE